MHNKLFITLITCILLVSCDSKQGYTPVTNSEFNVNEASKFIGKRVIVSLRNLDDSGNETFTGLWGIVVKVQSDGLLLEVEGGIEDEFWMLPPDVEALQTATLEAYEFMESTVVTDVDYEAYYSTADSLEVLENRDSK